MQGWRRAVTDIEEDEMSGSTDRSWLNLLVLLLASVLLAGCFQTTEQRENSLRGFAKEFVTALEVDIVEERHGIRLSGQHDIASSWISSVYIISDAPEEVREKLKALHDARDFWLAPSQDGWVGDVRLNVIPGLGRPWSPAEKEEDFKYSFSMVRESGIDFFVICPWLIKADRSYTTIYSDTVILTGEGALLVRLHSRARERCHDVNREQ